MKKVVLALFVAAAAVSTSNAQILKSTVSNLTTQVAKGGILAGAHLQNAAVQAGNNLVGAQGTTAIVGGQQVAGARVNQLIAQVGQVAGVGAVGTQATVGGNSLANAQVPVLVANVANLAGVTAVGTKATVGGSSIANVGVQGLGVQALGNTVNATVTGTQVKVGGQGLLNTNVSNLNLHVGQGSLLNGLRR